MTLTKKGELRGCIGHIPGDMPAGQIVGEMALRAAFDDPRFPPLEMKELADVDIEVSLLSPTSRIEGPKAIVIGRDGVVIHKDGRSAVFLPEVALEQGWSRDDLMDHICRKAGLDSSCWRSGCDLDVFQSLIIREKPEPPKAPAAPGAPEPPQAH